MYVSSPTVVQGATPLMGGTHGGGGMERKDMDSMEGMEGRRDMDSMEGMEGKRDMDSMEGMEGRRDMEHMMNKGDMGDEKYDMEETKSGEKYEMEEEDEDESREMEEMAKAMKKDSVIKKNK